jgi:hypothetical protein
MMRSKLMGQRSFYFSVCITGTIVSSSMHRVIAGRRRPSSIFLPMRVQRRVFMSGSRTRLWEDQIDRTRQHRQARANEQTAEATQVRAIRPHSSSLGSRVLYGWLARG